METFKDFLNEKMDDEVILQALADKDINAKIEKGVVYVDSDDVSSAKKVLKGIGCKMSVKGGLNESPDDKE